MENLILRTAVLNDLPILYEFEQGIVAAERPYDETLKSGHINYYDLRSMIESNDAEVIVAEIDKVIIASAYIKIAAALPYLNHTHYGHLGFMFVKPEFRGQGINKKILDKLKSWALKKDLTELRLDVYDENNSAIRAYEKAGFKKHMINMRLAIKQ